jgi:hypothetical protein
VRQLEVLIRHFFGRFFDNEFVAQNTEMQVAVTKMLALLASPGFILPWLRYTTYLGLDHMPPELRNPMMWSDRTAYLSFSMLVMGAVTVLEWDALFPDRRDYAALVPLPIHSRTIFVAKICALVLFVVAFTVPVNAVSTVMYPAVSYRGPFLGFLRTVAAQGISIFASSAFVFLFLVALQGVLLNVLSVRGFRKASAYVQGAMVFALLWLFFLFPEISGTVAELKARHVAVLFAFPPAWFLGMNEALLGSRDAVFLALADRAEWAVGVAALVAGLSYTVAYRRHVRRTLESTEGGDSTRTAVHEWIGRIADRLAPDPAERATVAFIGKTMARSAKHRIVLAAYAGVGCALAAQILTATTFHDGRIHDEWLSLPLVMGFFLLSGMRYVFTIPSELPANWQFRVADTNRQRQALNGARTAMRWFGVAPLFAALAPIYFVTWTPGVALGNLVFSIAISLLLIEMLTMEFRKIPFTCSYPPGKTNMPLLWASYWMAFLIYAFEMARMESWMVKRPSRLIPFYLIVAIMFAGFEWWRRRADSVGVTLIFEDAADPVVLTLGLGEIAWTTTATTRQESVVRRPSSSRVSRVE